MYIICRIYKTKIKGAAQGIKMIDEDRGKREERRESLECTPQSAYIYIYRYRTV